MIDDPVMQALFYPAQKNFISLPETGPILVANGIMAPALHTIDPLQLHFWQWWKGLADPLFAHGFPVSQTIPDGPFTAALIRIPRQREEGFALMAQAWERLETDGIMVAAAANDAGGGRLEKDILPWYPALQSTSKHRCRIVWAIKDKTSSPPSAWHNGAELQKHEKLSMWTMPGLFSWDRIDTATTLLLDTLPEQKTGTFADLGCGYGAISLEILKRNPECESLLCVDADARALRSCRKNIEDRFPDRNVSYQWHDLLQPLAGTMADHVIMNPPFHRDRAESIILGKTFITRAREILSPGGSLLMVANAHLPYEDHLRRLFRIIEKRHEGHGFKIYQASQPF